VDDATPTGIRGLIAADYALTRDSTYELARERRRSLSVARGASAISE
jgi:hypothetical protein